MYVAQTTDPTLNDGESPDPEACWALLERIVASPRFQRAARLREFLLYVGRRTLKEGCDQIHEQELGSEVFGRAGYYDTSVDNIVRVNATELRKRIEAYFETDGAHETLVLEIPRGSYKPVFHSRAVAPTAAPVLEPATVPLAELPVADHVAEAQLSEPVAEPLAAAVNIAPEVAVSTPAATGASSGRRLVWLAAAAIMVLALGCGVLWMQNRAMHRSLRAWQSTPAVSSFWSGILDARPNTDVILADTSFALIEDITRKPIPLNDYLNRKYISEMQTQALSPDRRDDLNLIVSRNYGSVGDFRVAQRIAALEPLGQKIHLHFALEYTPALLKQDNVILIGSRKSNPWVDLFENNLNFTVDYDPNRLVSFVRNRAPKAGEQEIYTAPQAPDGSSGYSVVAYLPSQDEGGKVLIIAGTGSEATEGAGEFVTSEDQLAQFQKLLHVDKLPYFEVLLKTTHLSATPLNATVVAYRTYPR